MALPPADSTNHNHINIDATATSYDVGVANGITPFVNFMAKVNEVSYLADRPRVIAVPDGIFGNLDDIPYEKSGDYNNLVIYRPYGNDPSQYSISQYPTIIAIKGTNFGNYYDLIDDLDLTLAHFGITSGTTYESDKNEYYNLIVSYLVSEHQTISSNRNIIITGHSLGGTMAHDIAYKLMTDTPTYTNIIHKVITFNPFICATTSHDAIVAASKDASNPISTVLINAFDTYMTRNDFAPKLMGQVDSGFGNVYIYPYLTVPRTTLNDVTYLAYLLDANHRIANWSGEGGQNGVVLPVEYHEHQVLSTFLAQFNNSTAVIKTIKAEPMPIFYDDPQGNADATTPHHLKLTTDGTVFKLNTRRTDGGVGPVSANYEWVINMNKNSYYIYNKDSKQWITPSINMVNNISGGWGRNIYLIHAKDTNTNNYNILDISQDKILMVQIGNFNSKNLPEDLQYKTKVTYDALAISHLIRGQWYLDHTDPNPIGNVPWFEDGSRRLALMSEYNPPTQPTNFELVLGLGPNSGLTNFNTYLISKGACYQTDTADNVERFILLDANRYYYAYPQTSATTADGIQGLGAVAPDTEVWNISFDTTNSVWNISNTNTSINNRLFEDVSNDGMGSSELYGYISSGSSYNFSSLPVSVFPYTNQNLTVINNGDGYYQIYFMYNGVKQYLFVQQNSYSHGHTFNYGYLTLIAESNLDNTKTDATKFKIANNVATSSGIY